MTLKTLVKRYTVLFYSISQFTGWALLLVGIIMNIIESKYHVLRDPSVFELVNIIQGLQYFELLFSLLRFNESRMLPSLVQVTARNLVVWFVFPLELRSKSPGIQITVLICWCLVDMIRFATNINEGMKLGSNVMRIIRYNAFIILTPVGFTAEFFTARDAQRTLESENKDPDLRFYGVSLPINAIVFLKIVQTAVFPCLIFAYRHLWKMRRQFYEQRRIEKEKLKRMKRE